MRENDASSMVISGCYKMTVTRSCCCNCVASWRFRIFPRCSWSRRCVSGTRSHISEDQNSCADSRLCLSPCRRDNSV